MAFKDLVFGKTIIRSKYASEDNPQREGVFVETVRRKGRMNPGIYLRVTDTKGKFWEYPVDSVEIKQPAPAAAQSGER